MKKYLFLLLSICMVAFVACGDDDDDKYVFPQISPNNTNITVAAAGGTKTITVSNAENLQITQINEKTTGANNKTSEINVMSIKNGKLKDSRNVTEAGWFAAKVDGKTITITVTENSDTENSRDKYIHVDCGGNVYGISLHLVQEKKSK